MYYLLLIFLCKQSITVFEIENKVALRLITDAAIGHGPLEIVLELMIDEDVPSLGHRLVMFTNYTKIGISIQPHKKYEWNTVLDFGR